MARERDSAGAKPGDMKAAGARATAPVHRWAIDQHIKDVPHEEVVRLAAAAFGGGQA